MEFFRYLNVLRKHLGLILLLTLLGGGSAFGFSVRQHKVYEATATLLINAAAPASLIPYLGASVNSATGVAPVDALANTYSVFLQSRSFDALVSRTLHLGVAPEQLGAHISSALIPGTNYFKINVTWGDPAQAAAIATGIARIFIRENAASQAAQTVSAAAEVNQSLSYFRNKIKALQRRYDWELARPNPNTALLSALESELGTLNDTYYKLLATAGSSSVTAGTNTAALSDPAAVPVAPISPHVKQNAIFGLLAGLLLAMALAFLLDYLDYSLRTPEDLEQLAGQAPLGIVSKIDEVSGAKRRWPFGRAGKTAPGHATVAMSPNGNGHGAGGRGPQDAPLTPLSVLSHELVTLSHPKASISEGFRVLRTNLDFSSLDKPLKSLVVTSSLPAEGKSTVSANLAISMAQAGKRVILVDADLRRPSVGRLFGLKSTTGFTYVLLNREDRARALDAALHQTMVPGLLVMPSGPLPPNPAELLAAESIAPVLRDLEARADLVIFDTPPMGPLTDAVVLSARVSGTLLVVKAGSTRRTVITNSINALHKVGANVVGTVLNMVDVKAISNYSYYYYYQTEYYTPQETKAAGVPSM